MSERILAYQAEGAGRKYSLIQIYDGRRWTGLYVGKIKGF